MLTLWVYTSTVGLVTDYANLEVARDTAAGASAAYWACTLSVAGEMRN